MMGNINRIMKCFHRALAVMKRKRCQFLIAEFGTCALKGVWGRVQMYELVDGDACVRPYIQSRVRSKIIILYLCAR